MDSGEVLYMGSKSMATMAEVLTFIRCANHYNVIIAATTHLGMTNELTKIKTKIDVIKHGNKHNVYLRKYDKNNDQW